MASFQKSELHKSFILFFFIRHALVFASQFAHSDLFGRLYPLLTVKQSAASTGNHHRNLGALSCPNSCNSSCVAIIQIYFNITHCANGSKRIELVHTGNIAEREHHRPISAKAVAAGTISLFQA